MQFDVVTLFPEMFRALTDWGITSRAAKQERYGLRTWNPRDFTTDNYRTIDDRPYGGGPGMVMLAKPLEDAIGAAKAAQAEQGIGASRVVMMSPQGAHAESRSRDAVRAGARSGAAVRPLRSDRPAFDRPCRRRRSQPWRLRAVGRRTAGDGADGCRGASVARRARTTRSRRCRTVSSTCCWIARTTRGRKNTTACGCPMCCLAAIMRKSKRGVGARRSRNTLKKRPDLIVKARKNKMLSRADEAWLASLAKEESKA